MSQIVARTDNSILSSIHSTYKCINAVGKCFYFIFYISHVDLKSTKKVQNAHPNHTKCANYIEKEILKPLGIIKS